MERIGLCVAAALLAGCATTTTTAGYSAMVDKWLGQSETTLVRQWGPPARAYDAGGRRFVQYIESRNVSMPGVAPNYTATTVGSQSYITAAGGMDAWVANVSCQTNFEIDQGKIVAVRFRGNGCRS